MEFGNKLLVFFCLLPACSFADLSLWSMNLQTFFLDASLLEVGHIKEKVPWVETFWGQWDDQGIYPTTLVGDVIKELAKDQEVKNATKFIGNICWNAVQEGSTALLKL
eukprot:12114415-Ditylum_brightwellii.AAC.1